MHAGRHYTFKEVFLWTRRETFVFVALGILPPLLHAFGVPLPPVPWQPIAVLGTAVAFITGFKSNAAYGRLWEARKIQGLAEGPLWSSFRAPRVEIRDGTTDGYAVP